MKEKSKSNGWFTLWIWVVLTFVLLGAAWYTLISVANKYAPEEIPLDGSGSAAAEAK